MKPVVSSSYSTTIFCPMCNEQVAGTRFAPHLEKCMNGGKRGSRKYNDALFDDSMYRLPTKPRVAEIPDPYPSSLIVKVRLKQGGENNTPASICPLSYILNLVVPYGNTRRIGASLEDFKNGTVGCAVLATVTTTSKETIKKDSANGNKKNGSIKYLRVEGQGES